MEEASRLSRDQRRFDPSRSHLVVFLVAQCRACPNLSGAGFRCALCGGTGEVLQPWASVLPGTELERVLIAWGEPIAPGLSTEGGDTWL